jgi:hypothetical protein
MVLMMELILIKIMIKGMIMVVEKNDVKDHNGNVDTCNYKYWNGKGSVI